MKERPILFSAPMVRALLGGSKTQTRRICKPAEKAALSYVVDCQHGQFGDEEGAVLFKSPYGEAGDRLWVRETCRADELPSGLDGVRYLANDGFIEIENSEEAAEKWGELACYGMKKSGLAECRNVPSIHMPRWASRILLEITGVRVERLQDISEADARAEGAPPSHPSIDRISREFGYEDFPRSWYAQLWGQINGPGSWEANPWVWVVEFKRVKQEQQAA